jgi:integrase
LEKTDGINPATKQGFLFSCFTGLRISDVRALTWGNLQKGNDGEMFISHVQKKTKKQEYLPIPKVAKKYLPMRGDDAKDTDKAFNLRSNSTLNGDLKVWAALAGVKKRLSLHVSRHSFATILLSLGERIEVVSKLLGHSDIKITLQHYAAIEDQLKRDAVSRFDKLEGFAE